MEDRVLERVETLGATAADIASRRSFKVRRNNSEGKKPKRVCIVPRESRRRRGDVEEEEENDDKGERKTLSKRGSPGVQVWPASGTVTVSLPTRAGVYAVVTWYPDVTLPGGFLLHSHSCRRRVLESGNQRGSCSRPMQSFLDLIFTYLDRGVSRSILLIDFSLPIHLIRTMDSSQFIPTQRQASRKGRQLTLAFRCRTCRVGPPISGVVQSPAENMEKSGVSILPDTFESCHSCAWWKILLCQFGHWHK